MPRFHYQALNSDGQFVDGDVDADGAAHAIALVEALGLAVQSIAVATPSSPLSRQEGRPEDDSLRVYLAQTLQRCQPIAPALRAYAEEMPVGHRRSALHRVADVVAQGDVAAAAAEFERAPEWWIPLVGSAAAGHDSGEMLDRFIADSRGADEARRQWWTLLAYPLLLVGVAMTVLVALAHIVVPTFRSIFEDFDLTLPTITLWTLHVSHWSTTRQALIIATLLLAVGGLAIFLGQRTVGSWCAAIFGRFTQLARLTRFTADLLAAGIGESDALRIASCTVHSQRLGAAGGALAPHLNLRDVAALQRFQRPLSATVVYALAAEMPPTARIRLLQELSVCYADRARTWASWTQGLLGPLTMLFVGGLVGFVALSLFVPLVDLINNLTG